MMIEKAKAVASKTPFKTLMEFCPSDENLELAVRAIARNKRRFTADDLHVLDHSVFLLGRKRQVYGPILAHQKKLGFIRSVGYVVSSREECHNRPVILWECTEV